MNSVYCFTKHWPNGKYLNILSVPTLRYSLLLAYFDNMDFSEVNVPPLKDLTIDNITDNVKLINSQCPNPRLKYILDRIVQHLHDFARETRLSHEEWMTGLHFLTAVGQICTDVRQVSIP